MAIFMPAGKDVMGKEIGRFGREQRQEYARRRSELEERKLCQNKESVQKMAELFEKRVEQERARLGLGNAII